MLLTPDETTTGSGLPNELVFIDKSTHPGDKATSPISLWVRGSEHDTGVTLTVFECKSKTEVILHTLSATSDADKKCSIADQCPYGGRASAEFCNSIRGTCDGGLDSLGSDIGIPPTPATVWISELVSHLPATKKQVQQTIGEVLSQASTLPLDHTGKQDLEFLQRPEHLETIANRVVAARAESS